MRNMRKKPLRERKSAASEVARLRVALEEMLVEVDFSELPQSIRPKAKRVDREALFRSLPRLKPPLSATIIEERSELL
jgi:hypothetical protein